MNEAPPLYIKTADDQWEGLSIDIWKAVAQDMDILFEFREYKSFGILLNVGYGDKTPKTIGGRIVAIIWMLFSIVFIAGFTANITASLTISELRGKVRGFNDLSNAQRD